MELLELDLAELTRSYAALMEGAAVGALLCMLWWGWGWEDAGWFMLAAEQSIEVEVRYV